MRRALGLSLGAVLALSGGGLAAASAAQATPLTHATPLQQPRAGEVAEAPALYALQSEAEGVVTRTTLHLLSNPTKYGDPLVASATVEPDGPANLSGQELVLEANGVVIGRSILIYVGSGKFVTLIPFMSPVPAGTHRLVARFAGSSDGIPGLPDALPSESAPIELTIAQVETATTITSAPETAQAFAPIDVTAQVAAAGSVPEGEGEAALLADGTPVLTAGVEPDGRVAFAGAMVPAGTTGLAVAYLGDPAGNFAPSTSADSPLTVAALATRTELSVSAAQTRVDAPATASATVLLADPAVRRDPRGAVEFRVNGEPVSAAPVTEDRDAAADDGVARFDLELTDLLPGAHEITAEFVPEAGFGGSAGEAAQLRVLGIETVLAPAAQSLEATPTRPATVEVVVSAADVDAASGLSVDGVVQAFVADQPLGAPFDVRAGAGSGTLSGLPIGAHEVELRFTPAAPSVLPSSARVSVRVAADAAPDGDGEGDGDRGEATPDPQQPERPERGDAPRAANTSAQLSVTGAAGSAPLALGGIALVLGAAGILLAARRAARPSARG